MTIFEFYAAPPGTPGNALLNWTQQAVGDVVAYAASYRRAAHALVARRERSLTGDVGHAACPIIFLYRHSLELYLKAVIYRAACLTIDDAELPLVLPRLWKDHSLLRLLDMAPPLFHALDLHLPSGLRRLRDEILEIATIFDQVDPGSSAFRYPITSVGRSSLPSHLLVNIFLFAERADSTLDHLNIFCIHLMRESVPPSKQMSLALSPIRRVGEEGT